MNVLKTLCVSENGKIRETKNEELITLLSASKGLAEKVIKVKDVPTKIYPKNKKAIIVGKAYDWEVKIPESRFHLSFHGKATSVNDEIVINVFNKKTKGAVGVDVKIKNIGQSFLVNFQK